MYGQIQRLEVVGVTDTRPREYRVRVDGLEMTVGAEALNNQRTFNRECIEQLGRSFVPLATEEWHVEVNRALERHRAQSARRPADRRRLIRPVA
jgi:hypothetical protein